uniref:Uncharacterized protein n=1 Tax=Rhizophora mucronata TaxID=61149 RepID=A0A2P2NS20_RHIMU
MLSIIYYSVFIIPTEHCLLQCCTIDVFYKDCFLKENHLGAQINQFRQ